MTRSLKVIGTCCNLWLFLPNIVWVHPERSYLISDGLCHDSDVVLHGDVGGGGDDHGLIEPGDVDHHAEHHDRNQNLSDRRHDPVLGILFPVLVGVAHRCESLKNTNVKICQNWLHIDNSDSAIWLQNLTHHIWSTKSKWPLRGRVKWNFKKEVVFHQRSSFIFYPSSII